MMQQYKSLFISLIVVGLFLSFTCLYTVREGQEALLLRLGKITMDSKTGKAAVKGPGLHFKLPIIHSARIFDTRLQTLDIKSSRIVTDQKKDVLVDSYVKWRIKDLPLYFTRTGGNESQAETLLEQKVNNGLRAEFGKRNIDEVVSGKRQDIMKILQQEADVSAKNLGIEIIDVRIKRIDLPLEVSSTVFELMRAEREQNANEHRSQGKAEAEKIRAGADANVTITLASANSQGKQIRAQGDAQAAAIYANAYKDVPEFYNFYRSLEAYRKTFTNKKDVIILGPDSDFFKYFNKVTDKTS